MNRLITALVLSAIAVTTIPMPASAITYCAVSDNSCVCVYSYDIGGNCKDTESGLLCFAAYGSDRGNMTGYGCQAQTVTHAVDTVICMVTDIGSDSDAPC